MKSAKNWGRLGMKFDVVQLESTGIDVIDGDRGKNYPHQNELLSTGFCLFLSAKNVTKSGFSFSETQFISQRKDALLNNGRLCRGDIVITTRGTVGNVVLYSPQVPYENIRINSGMLIIRCANNISNQYLYQVLRSEWFQKQIMAVQSGSAQPQLPKSHFLKMNIPLPPLPIQEKIASILQLIDDKITTNNSINDNLYEMVNAYYTSLFKDVECEMTTIGNYAERIYSGGTPTTSNAAYWGGTFGWFSSGETRNRFVISTEKSITQTGIDNSSTKLASKHDIVMASAGQGFTRGQTSMLLIDTYVNQSVIVIHADRNILPYLFWNLANRYEELRAISDSSSIRGSLTTKMIAAFEIPLANNDVIQTFSDFAWAVIPQIENNLLENERLAALRDSLLPKLMSGELDVSDIEI
jgi:type I restriction enzyme S subunit